ncbi:MAG: hypothetical protein RSA62_07980 [Oscillospiraceae bacterium]
MFVRERELLALVAKNTALVLRATALENRISLLEKRFSDFDEFQEKTEEERKIEKEFVEGVQNIFSFSGVVNGTGK